MVSVSGQIRNYFVPRQTGTGPPPRRVALGKSIDVDVNVNRGADVNVKYARHCERSNRWFLAYVDRHGQRPRHDATVSSNEVKSMQASSREMPLDAGARSRKRFAAVSQTIAHG